MKRIMLLAGLCLLLAALSACSSNRAGRGMGGGESAGIGQEQENDLLTQAPAIDPTAGSAAGMASAEPNSRAPTNSGNSDWH
jgi:hypothetical protein